MHTGGVEGWKNSKYEYRDQLEVSAAVIERSSEDISQYWILSFLQELVATAPSSRDWTGIFISLLVISSIIGNTFTYITVKTFLS